MTTSEIQELIALAKKAGLRRIKTPEIELEFGPPEAKPMDLEAMQKIAEAVGKDSLTDEEALFMSAPQMVSDEKMQEILKQMGIGSGGGEG